jgi:hypothetical protein
VVRLAAHVYKKMQKNIMFTKFQTINDKNNRI